MNTLIDSYGDLAKCYAALKDENAALKDENAAIKARIAELERENDKKGSLCWDLEQQCKRQEEAIKDLVKGWDEWKEENAALKTRIAELEAERDALQDRVVDLEECVWDINGYAWVADTENAALEEQLAKAKRKLEESVPLSAMNELEGMLAKAEEERDALKARVEALEAEREKEEKEEILIPRELYKHFVQRGQFLWERIDQLEAELAAARSYGG